MQNFLPSLWIAKLFIHNSFAILLCLHSIKLDFGFKKKVNFQTDWYILSLLKDLRAVINMQSEIKQLCAHI